jgi:hypothetical protein
VLVLVPIAVLVGIVGGVTRDEGATWLAFIGAMVLFAALSGNAIRVFSVALYRYATTSEPQPPFAKADLERPFTPKRGLFRRSR